MSIVDVPAATEDRVVLFPSGRILPEIPANKNNPKLHVVPCRTKKTKVRRVGQIICKVCLVFPSGIILLTVGNACIGDVSRENKRNEC